MWGGGQKVDRIFSELYFFPIFLSALDHLATKLRLLKYVPTHITTKTKQTACAYLYYQKKKEEKNMYWSALSHSKKKILMSK